MLLPPAADADQDASRWQLKTSRQRKAGSARQHLQRNAYAAQRVGTGGAGGAIEAPAVPALQADVRLVCIAQGAALQAGEGAEEARDERGGQKG